MDAGLFLCICLHINRKQILNYQQEEIMIIKEFKNGNFNLKPEAEDIAALKNSSVNECLAHIMTRLDMSDMYIASEEYCFGNSDMAVDIENVRLRKHYTVLFSELLEFKAGKMIKLYAYKDIFETDDAKGA